MKNVILMPLIVPETGIRRMWYTSMKLIQYEVIRHEIFHEALRDLLLELLNSSFRGSRFEYTTYYLKPDISCKGLYPMLKIVKIEGKPPP